MRQLARTLVATAILVLAFCAQAMGATRVLVVDLEMNPPWSWQRSAWPTWPPI